VADNGHAITMSARLGSKNAKAILGIVVGDALDETSEHLLRLILGPVFHGRRGRITGFHACHSACNTEAMNLHLVEIATALDLNPRCRCEASTRNQS